MSDDESVNGPETPEVLRRATQQQELMGDVAVVSRYAESMDPDEWAGMWFDNDRDPVVIVAAVTGRVELHRTQLRAQLTRPEQLEVVRHERSARRLREVHDEVLRLRGEYPISSVGIDVVANVVSVGLSVDDASLRADLQSRFGPEVRVERGIWSAWAV